MEDLAKTEILADELVIFHNSISSSNQLIAQAEALNRWEEHSYLLDINGNIQRYGVTLDELSSFSRNEIHKNIESYKDFLGYSRHTFEKDNEYFSLHISKYVDGGGIGAHRDVNISEEDGNYTVIIYLNDEYDGGELGFPDLNIEIKPKSGDMLVFPNSYLHYAKESWNGAKYLTIFKTQFFK